MQVTLEKGKKDLFNQQIRHLLPTKNNNAGAHPFPQPNSAVAALVLENLVQKDKRFYDQAVRKMARARMDKIGYFHSQVAAKDNLLNNTEINKNMILTNTSISRLTNLKCCKRLRVV